MKTQIPFVGPSYEARSTNVDAQRTLNCFMEMDNASTRAPTALYGTPGLRKVVTLPTGPVRNSIAEKGYVWVVSGNTVYRVDKSYAVITVGTINTSIGQISMASNGSEIIIVDGVNGYIISTTSLTVSKITDTDFPNGVKRAAYNDGYFLVAGDGSQKFYISGLLAGTQWNGLDFASAEGSPDNTLGLIVDHREVWLFGSDSAEIWIDTGAAAFPFERSGNTFIEHGCVASASPAKLDNTVFWLGGGETGPGIVWRANGYTPVRVSTHALEFAINSYGDVSDAYAMTYQQEGHGFYVLTFPTAGKTWAYDVATQMWHERAYTTPLTGVESQWRGSCHSMLGNDHLIGDYEDGRLYVMDLDHFTDDGDSILRLRAAATISQMQNRLFFSELHVDMETGVGLSTGAPATLMMRYSNDGGHTWSNIKEASVGLPGQYSSRARFHRLGQGRNRTWEVSMTDPVKFVILGALVDAIAGTS
jgi:hypothetical protein